ncbi:MAG: hypothetical protein A2Z12_05905 [Actinobacteria bacterium RBG_16_68_21]|nr:MAG: hypothetical protein A2Z12_05905 [Actinobacteria bacterium RBG_16_68_21]
MATPGTALSEPDPAWDRLARRVGVPPFSRPGWVQAWTAMTRFAPDLVRVERDGELVGLLPTVRRGGGLATAADWHVPVLEAVALDATALRDLAEAAISGRFRVSLASCDSLGATAAAFRKAFAAHGFVVRERPQMHSPFIDLRAGRAAYEATLDSKRMRELARRRRRLQEEGAVTIGVDDGSTDLEAALTEGFAVEGSGWKGAAGTAIRSAPATEHFYRTVARWAAAEGLLRLSFLRVAGRAIGFDLALVSGGREWLLKTGYSPAWARFSPGSQLRAAAIDRAFDEGLTHYEFAGSADPWKLEWTGTKREIVLIDGFAPTIRGRACLVGSRLARRIRTVTSKTTRRTR